MAAKPSGPKPTPEDGSRRRLWAKFGEEPIEAIGVLLTALGALGGGLYLLGYWTQRAREALVHIYPLSYPQESLIFTGLDALFSLLWNGLRTPFSAQPQLSRSVFALLFLALLCWVGLRRLQGGKPWRALLALGLMAGLLTVGSLFYTFGLHATAPQGESESPGLCSNQLQPDWAARISYESCSWLLNDSPQNEEKRQSLAGLLTWLLLASLAALVAGWQLRSAFAKRGRISHRVLLGWHLLVLLFLLDKLPLAYAYSTWGLSYPAVTVTGDCSAELIEALEAGTCCAYEVSDAATTPVLLLRGKGCPGGGGQHAWAPGEAEKCTLTLHRRRPVVQGCS